MSDDGNISFLFLINGNLITGIDAVVCDNFMNNVPRATVISENQ